MSAPRRRPPEPLPVEPWFRSLTGVEGFLRAIAEEPWDAAHRLILADWLEERGEVDRADFVRLQVRAASLPTWLVPVHVQKRIDRLWYEHAGTWSAGLPANIEPFGGLLCELRTRDLSKVLPILEAVGDAADVHRLNLAGWHTGDWGFGRDFPPGMRLTMLDRSSTAPTPLDPGLDLTELGELRWTRAALASDAVRSLAVWLDAPKLHTLDLSQNAFDAAGLQALGEEKWLAGSLRHLRVNDNVALGDDGADAIAAGSAFAALATLEMSATALTSASLPALVGAGLGQLQTLGLGGNRLDADAASVLAGAASLRRLRHLDMSHNPIGPAGLAALASSPHLARLEGLNVRDCGGEAAGAKALARTEHLTGLTALSIGGNRLGTRGVQALAASPALGSLQALGLSNNKVGPGGARALARSKTLRHLWSLHLGDNALGDAGVEALVDSEIGRNRVALVLTGNDLTDAAAQALAASPHLAHLGALTLDRNHIGGPGVRALVESPHLRRLFALNLRDNPLSSEDAALLRARWPFVECSR